MFSPVDLKIPADTHNYCVNPLSRLIPCPFGRHHATLSPHSRRNVPTLRVGKYLDLFHYECGAALGKPPILSDNQVTPSVCDFAACFFEGFQQKLNLGRLKWSALRKTSPGEVGAERDHLGLSLYCASVDSPTDAQSCDGL